LYKPWPRCTRPYFKRFQNILGFVLDIKILVHIRKILRCLYDFSAVKSTRSVQRVLVEPKRSRSNPRHRESVCDRHEVDHTGLLCAWPDLSEECAQVLYPHVLDGGLAVLPACIEIIHPLRHDIVLQHLHEQDGALVLWAHPTSLISDDEHVNHPAHSQLTCGRGADIH
jgi:hypothetical protein